MSVNAKVPKYRLQGFIDKIEDSPNDDSHLYTIDEQGRKKGTSSHYDPVTGSWTVKPFWDYDDDWDYKNVKGWYHHNGRRDFGYSDTHAGWHPLPSNSPRKVRKPHIWNRTDYIILAILFLIVMVGMLTQAT